MLLLLLLVFQHHSLSVCIGYNIFFLVHHSETILCCFYLQTYIELVHRTEMKRLVLRQEAQRVSCFDVLKITFNYLQKKLVQSSDQFRLTLTLTLSTNYLSREMLSSFETFNNLQCSCRLYICRLKFAHKKFQVQILKNCKKSPKSLIFYCQVF